MENIKGGHSVINAQLDHGDESKSRCQDTLSRLMEHPPSKSGAIKVLHASWIDTPLCPMLAIGDEQKLYLLEFVGRRGLEREIERLHQRLPAAIVPGSTAPIRSIESELKRYFEGTLKTFNTPIICSGTPFQKRVWEELQKIPYGTTLSYIDLAKTIGKPTACRAVAQANGANQLALIIPCHRVINANGELGGYGGGVQNKRWLLDHEEAQRDYTETTPKFGF